MKTYKLYKTRLNEPFLSLEPDVAENIEKEVWVLLDIESIGAQDFEQL